MQDQRILQDMIYTSALPMNEQNYEIWIREICDKLDIPVPVVLGVHFLNFVRFHNTKFRPEDFVESLGCDMFIVEDCKE